MTDDCEDRLLEIQYFLAREWSLDPKLVRACDKDAKEMCARSKMKPIFQFSRQLFVEREMVGAQGRLAERALRVEHDGVPVQKRLQRSSLGRWFVFLFID